MRIFLAATTSGMKGTQRKHAIEKCKPLYLLETFNVGENKCATVQKDVGTENFLLDSGAFSFMQGKPITILQMEEYIEKYIAHIKKYNVKYYFEMDVDSVFGISQVELWRNKIERETGIQSIPVWHKSRGIDYYKNLVSNYKYIAIGGYANKEIKPKEYPITKKMIEFANSKSVKVHGLGFTQMKYLFDYPFYSVDSSSWNAYATRGGQISKFVNGKIVGESLRNENKLKLSNMAQYSFSEWVKFQKYMNMRR